MTRERFTLDASAKLERHLERTCQQITSEVQRIVPQNKLEALVLAGGYGRGEGGVLRTDAGERPYNDLEFYVFILGNRLLNDRAYGPVLHNLGHRLSPEAGLDVEFKVESLNRMRHTPVSIFTHDLVAAHRLLFGDERMFAGCEHHLQAAEIPVSEAARLLLNRCTGLLLAREVLASGGSRVEGRGGGRDSTDAGHNSTRDASSVAELRRQDTRHFFLPLEQSDFVGRNLAKAQLCLGDAVLAALGQHHWSCTERHRRLRELVLTESWPWLKDIRQHHAAGVEFKLHPRRISKPAAEFEHEHGELRALALKVWLWLESRRLGCSFSSVRDYAFYRFAKWPDAPRWRNYLLNLRTFGAKAALAPLSFRYPRERLLNALPLLLWNGEVSHEPHTVRYLQKQLASKAADWAGLVTAYKKIWPQYG